MTGNEPDERTQPTEFPPPAAAPPPPDPGPPGPPGAPPAAPAQRASRPITIGPGQVLVLLGVAAITVSMFLHWLDVTISALGFSRSTTAPAGSVPFKFLFDHLTSSNDPSILIVLIPIAVLALADVFVFRNRIVTLIAGIVALVVVGLYAYQLDQLASDLNDRSRGIFNLDLFDLMGVGAYVCFAGALALIVGALLTKTAARAPDPVFAGPSVPPAPLGPPPSTAVDAAPAPPQLDAPPERPTLDAAPVPPELPPAGQPDAPPESTNPS